jgi:hypothetical protein
MSDDTVIIIAEPKKYFPNVKKLFKMSKLTKFHKNRHFLTPKRGYPPKWSKNAKKHEICSSTLADADETRHNCYCLVHTPPPPNLRILAILRILAFLRKIAILANFVKSAE